MKNASLSSISRLLIPKSKQQQLMDSTKEYYSLRRKNQVSREFQIDSSVSRCVCTRNPDKMLYIIFELFLQWGSLNVPGMDLNSNKRKKKLRNARFQVLCIFIKTFGTTDCIKIQFLNDFNF